MTYFAGSTFDRLIAELESYAEQFDTRAQADVIHETIARLREYTSGRAPTLDHAFGLVARPGKRVSPESFELACRAYELKYRGGQNRTWAQIEEALDAIHTANLDGDALKNLVHRNMEQVQTHFARIDAAELLKDLQQVDAKPV